MNQNQRNIRKQLINHLMSDSDDYSFMEKYIFGNYGGTRLSKSGLQLLSQFNHYEFALPKDIKITAKILVTLNKNINFPYYIDSKKLILFSEDDAKLYSMIDDLTIFVKSI